ncbi:hypothetical protein NIES2101_08825 [Calothrix sp. HK-06]|nr:hypothetical protein NIES2101_08825 [Calothrix sp. HK-06]
MRNNVKVSRKKTSLSNTTNPSLSSPNIPTLGSPIRGFTPEINTSAIQTLPDVSSQTRSNDELEPEPLKQAPVVHNISRISLRPQAKLTVGAPGDKYEQEADAMASQVMSMSNSAVQRMAPSEQTEDKVQTKPLAANITPLVQLEEAPEDELQSQSIDASIQKNTHLENKVQTKPSLQRVGDDSFQAGSNIESQLNSSKGEGSFLAENVRSFMEPRFGTDFSSVRVHTGNEAVQMNRELGAQAFTHGSDIYFGGGKALDNNELTAHELTHVVQQTGKIQRQLRQTGTAEVTPPSQQQVRTIEASTGSVSWIDPSSPAGSGQLGVPDPVPPATISEGFITGSSGFRFSNYLHGYLTTNDSRTIASSGLHSNSGIYTSPSQFGLPSERFPIIRSQTNITQNGIQGVQFKQLVGARTISAGVAAGTIGAGVGIAAGALTGAKLGAAGGTFFGPLGTVGGGVVLQEECLVA